MSPQNNGTEPNGEHHGSNGITLEKRNAADANGKTATPENGVNGITHTAVGIIEDDKDAAPRKLCCGGGKDGKPLEERVSFFNLFRFATVFDKFLMIVGSLAMFIVGAGLPMNLYFFGELLTSFILIDASKNMPPTSADNITTAVNNITSTPDLLNSNSLRTKCAAKYQESISAEPLNPQALQIKLETVYVPAFVSIGVLALALYYIGMTFWKWTAERQITKIRITFFQAIIRQSVGWFDVTDTGALNTRLVEDIDRIQDGVGDKIATFIQWLATFIGGFGIGFVSGPKLAGVIVCASPLMVIIGAAFSRFIRTLVKKELVAYSKAGSIAEETFAAIRTVAAFGGEEKAEEKYGHNLKDATKEGVRKSTMAGLMVGIFWTVIFSIFALAFWYGAKLVREECLPPGTILQVVFGVLIGAMSLGNAVPLIENFGNARGGAAAIYKIIDTHTEIDSHSEEGIKPENVEGNVDFCDVEFSYPARPELKILNKLNLSVSKGQTIALVGESGCGKSTTVHLLQRFYECAAGSVKVDGRDIRDYNLRWLRDHMGIVGQEPVLFAESILQNIKLGGRTQASEDVTPQQIEDACKMANCYDFIKKLPQGFDTLVGERGIQLSGGQKQRIAIARALVRNPTILLLDEATSALDTQSEKIVQDALNKASEGRTTIVIAHRLSTVKNADRIYAFRSGVVNESGTHDELMKKGGVYYSLCMRQMKQEEEEKTQLQADITGINNIKGGHPETPAHEPKQNNEEDAISHSSETLAVVSLDDYLVKRDHSLRRSSHHRASTRSARSILGVETPDAVDTLLSGVVTSDEEVEIKPDTKTADISYLDILSMNKPEWYYIVFGVLGALVVGSIQPMFALVMSEIIGRLSIDDLVRQERETSEVIAYILGVGLGAALSSLIMQFFLSMSGEKLTERLRKKTFHQLCRQEIGYFDSEENGVGVLMTRLSADASLVKGATGLRIGVITQTLTIIIASLIIAFLAVWQLTLVMVIFMPISIVAGAVQVKAMRGYAEGDQKAIEIGSKMAQEVISNIRTVTSLNRQTHFYDNYANHFNNLYRESRTRIFTSGITYAIANSMVYFLYGVNFGYGGWLVLNIPDLEFFLIFRVFACVQFGGMAIGRASANLPDYARAKLAAAKIKELFQRESLIDHTSQSGEKLESCDGVVEFSKVAFRYPSRPNVKVLRGLTVKINKGETLALVGSSGCGKSTSVSLLERFYDPVSGSVCLSGVPTTDLNVRSLRQQLGLVSQEPTLFDVSIRENIEYGDNSRSVSMDEVIDAAKQANIHNFITTLPHGYETEVGSHGTQLSGGQKQRIAIARALVRNPSVLLLDEATSALDTESEKVVQEALERAQQGRTSIIIAHRLTTVKNADKIALIDQGKVAEIGTHSQLIAMKGQYYNLINAQL